MNKSNNEVKLKIWSLLNICIKLHHSLYLAMADADSKPSLAGLLGAKLAAEERQEEKCLSIN